MVSVQVRSTAKFGSGESGNQSITQTPNPEFPNRGLIPDPRGPGPCTTKKKAATVCENLSIVHGDKVELLVTLLVSTRGFYFSHWYDACLL
jgi:hypothetical protein